MKRGWTVPYKYLSERKQRNMLIDYGVQERVIYNGRAEWPAFVRALRSQDEAVVADLRVFASRKALREAVNEVEAKDALLVSAATDTCVDPVTLREVHRIETAWAGERSMGGSKRARMLSARGLAAYRAKIKASRIPEAEAEAKWRDIENYTNRADALKAMPGWTLMTAWRAFGAREK